MRNLQKPCTTTSGIKGVYKRKIKVWDYFITGYHKLWIIIIIKSLKVADLDYLANLHCSVSRRAAEEKGQLYTAELAGVIFLMAWTSSSIIKVKLDDTHEKLIYVV